MPRHYRPKWPRSPAQLAAMRRLLAMNAARRAIRRRRGQTQQGRPSRIRRPAARPGPARLRRPQPRGHAFAGWDKPVKW